MEIFKAKYYQGRGDDGGTHYCSYCDRILGENDGCLNCCYFILECIARELAGVRDAAIRVEEDLRERMNPYIRKCNVQPPELCQKDLAEALENLSPEAREFGEADK